MFRKQYPKRHPSWVAMLTKSPDLSSGLQRNPGSFKCSFASGPTVSYSGSLLLKRNRNFAIGIYYRRCASLVVLLCFES